MASALDRFLGISGKQKVFFFRQLATMVQAGMSYGQALDTLRNSTPGGPMRRWLDSAVPNLTRGGKPFASVFADYPWFWNPFVVSMVTAAERSGRMDVTLLTLADHLERQHTARLEFMVRMVYPVILIHGGILIPPVVTWYMQGFSAYVKVVAPAFIVLYGLVLMAFLAQRAATLRLVKETIDTVVLYVPLIGKFLQMSTTMWFVRSLGELYDSGIPVGRAVELSADAAGNLALARRFKSAIPMLNDGLPLSKAFGRVQALPLGVLNILQTSEQSGSIGPSMKKAGDLIELEVRTTLATMGVVVPMVIFLCIACYMGYTAVTMFKSIYAPILK